MSVKISDTLRQYLGWCPQTQGPMRRLIVQPYEPGNLSGGDSGTPTLNFAWYRQFRILIIVSIIPVVIFATWIYATLGGYQIAFALLGIIPAAILGGIDLVRTQRFFREVVTNGVANEITRSILTSITFVEAAAWILFFVFLFLTGQGKFTGLNPAATSALMSGFFIAFSAFYLIFIFAWEKSNGMRMYLKWPHYYVRKE